MKANEALKTYAKSNGIKQSFISEQSGIPESAVSRMLNGNIRMTADNFILICRALGVSTETVAEIARCRD